jgi:hypothetical protein
MAYLRHICREYVRENGEWKPKGRVLVRGPAGIGKSEIIVQFASSIKSDCVTIHLPQFDPLDMKGVPVRFDNEVRWMPSSYLPQCKLLEIIEGQNSYEVDFPNRRSTGAVITDSKGKRLAWVNWQDIANHNGSDIDLVREGKRTTVKLDSKKYDGCTLEIFERCVLFLDEITAANPDTQNACLQLVNDGMVNEYRVPKSCPIIAAGNREEDGAFVYQFTSPMANRFAHVTLKVSVDDFIDHAIRVGAHPLLIGFVKFHGMEALWNFDSDAFGAGNYAFTTPRSIMRLSEQLWDAPEEIVPTLIKSILGKENGARFLVFRNRRNDLPDPEEVLNGTITEPKENLKLIARYSMGMALTMHLMQKYDNLYQPAKRATEQSREWAEVCRNFIRFSDAHLGEEIVNLGLSILRKRKDINTAAILQPIKTIDPDFTEEVATKYLKLTKLVMTDNV